MNEDRFRRRAKNRLLILLAVLVVVGVVLWYFSQSSSLRRVSSFENAALGTVAQEIQKEVSNPAPLVATGTKPSAATAGARTSVLTSAGIIAQTNRARATNGDLSALSENILLDQIASARLGDMIAKQYFAHVSPSGSSAETVAQANGYNYIALGENLALGNFNGDVGVVAAWMASPGHRANILNTHYTEIGVAARQAIFNGEETWLAVQIFGRPASDCSAPDSALKLSIDAAETELTSMASELQSQQAAINVISPNDRARNDAIASYNALVATYNALLTQTKANISTYNVAIGTYNTCLGN